MIIEIALFAFLLVIAVAVARLEDLFAAAMLTGIFSLVSAGLFTLMDAVDVAFTEAAVGAGLSSVLFLSALGLTDRRERQQRPTRILPFVVVVLTGLALVYGTLDMPAYGDPTAPVHNDLTQTFLHGAEAMHIPNVVTVVLASYRGYDTLGETTVVFTAAVGVMMLLGRRREPDPVEEEPS